MIACEFCHKKLHYTHYEGTYASEHYYLGFNPRDISSMFDICDHCVEIMFEYMKKNIKCREKDD